MSARARRLFEMIRSRVGRCENRFQVEIRQAKNNGLGYRCYRYQRVHHRFHSPNIVELSPVFFVAAHKRPTCVRQLTEVSTHPRQGQRDAKGQWRSPDEIKCKIELCHEFWRISACLLEIRNCRTLGSYAKSRFHDGKMKAAQCRVVIREASFNPMQCRSPAPSWTKSELVRRRVHVIALENLVISLLARSSDRQLDLVREMPAYISPRTGLAPHHLTIRAAAAMIHLIERASHFWDMPTNERAVGLVTERGGARAAKCAPRWSFDLRIGCRESSS
jgi:hypothetical protein